MYEVRKYTEEELNEICKKFYGEWELGGHYGSESFDVELWDEEDLTFKGTGGYNVCWTDREERHPWVDVTVEYCLTTMEYKVEAVLESKDGRLYEDAERSGTFSEDTDIQSLIEDCIDEVCHDVEV